MFAKLFISLLLCQLSSQLITVNCVKQEILMQFLNEIIRRYRTNDLFIIYDELNKDFANNFQQQGLNQNVTYVIRDCNREKVLIENKLIIAIINSQNNNYHIDCFKYLTTYQIKMIVVDTYILLNESFIKMLRYLHYDEYDDDIIGVYQSNGTIVTLKYDNSLKDIRTTKLNETKMFIIEENSKNIQGEKLNVLIMDVTNELIIGNDVLKYDDDNLLENAVSSINGTIEYLKWDDIDSFNDLNEWKMKRYKIFAIITKQISQEIANLFQKTYPYEMEYLALIVPKTKPLALEQNIMMIHSQGIWFFFVFYDKLFGLVWTLMRIFTKQSCESLYCFSFHILFDDPFYSRLKKTAYESLLMLASVWFTFFAMSTFQVKIITSMTTLKFIYQIQSLKDLCKSNEPIDLFTFEQNIKSIVDIYEPSCNKLPLIIQPINNKNPSLFINELFLNVNNFIGKRTAFILDQNHAKLIATSRFNRAEGLPLYFITSDRLLPRFKSYHIRKTSSYYNVINKRIIYLYESGFQIYWSEQMRHKYRLKGLLYPNDYVDTDLLTKANVLKMLLYMFTLNTFAFVYIALELICKKLEVWLAKRNINLFFWNEWINRNQI